MNAVAKIKRQAVELNRSDSGHWERCVWSSLLRPVSLLDSDKAASVG
jgi:hypothetical protein